MSKTIVLAEKPSVGRDIARVLNCHKQGNGYFEGSKFIVTWALGHLVTLANPEVYDQKYKTWRLDDLPMLPKKLELVVIRKTSRQFNTVKRQLNRQDVKDIVIATDAGREGELVARWILEKARVRGNKPVKRLWISSVTDKAIRDGFKQLKPGKNYKNLYDSAVARSEADWYVGLNATRALTTKFNAQLSSGRVQTPTLAMIAARENEIQQFKPRKFYGIEVKTNKGIVFKWQDKNNQQRIFSKGKADQLVNQLTNKQVKIADVRRVDKKTVAPQLYDLTDLQRDANRLFGFSGRETLSMMQNLYERHKVLTYPRTDSRYISTDIIPTIKDRLNACGVDQYSRHAKKLLNKSFKLPRSVVDNSKVTDHHAIIPTEQPLLLHELNERERKIYDLVINRFFAVLSDPYEYEEISIRAKIDGEHLFAKGNFVKKAGWKELYGHSDDVASEAFRQLKKGDIITRAQVSLTTGETKPPSRFTEGTLLHAMENPARFMDDSDKHLVRTINKSGGLGTVATRADIIEKLFENMYIEKKGQSIFLTSKGRQLLDLVPEDLRSPALTAEWEQKLELIATGKLNKNEFINDMKAYAREVVKQIKQSDVTFKHDNLTGSNCPKCQKFMLEIDNQRGKMLVCQDRSCGHRRSIFKRTNARCPDCRKRMNLYGEGEGQTFVCSCGHREKLSTFNKRRQKAKNHRASRKDVNKYLKKQDDGFKNNALAEALAKFKK